MTYRDMFPDFAADALPAIPPTWQDCSWRNDACPSFDTGAGMIVFIDYADPQQREIEDTKRFSVHADPETTSAAVMFDSDDWRECLAFVLGEAFADVLKSWFKAKTFEEMKRLNETEAFADGCCASRNFCDANMAMDEAWRAVIGTEITADDEAQAKLWNDAWESARRRHLGVYVAPHDMGEGETVTRHPGPFTGHDAELARACAMAVIPVYGTDDAETLKRIAERGVWNDHVAVQAALAAIHHLKHKPS